MLIPEPNNETLVGPTRVVFDSTGPHYCPDGCFRCLMSMDGHEIKVRQKIQLIYLETVLARTTGERQKSTGDAARCPVCGKTFLVRYRVKQIVRYKFRDAVPGGKVKQP